MLISFRSVVDLLRKYYTVQSVPEFKSAHQQDINASLATAQTIEDYEYLSVFTDEAQIPDLLIAYTPHIAKEPILIEPGRDLTMFDFAKMHCDTKIPITQFYQIIELEAPGNGYEPNALMAHFDALVTTINNKRQASTKKVHRNDPCPCGSEKKYKDCHGAHF